MNGSILKRPLREIAALVGTGKVSALDLFNEAHNNALAAEALNVFTALSPTAEPTATGALAGIPFAAKDAIESVSLPTCAASPALKKLEVTQDAEVLTRLQQAGALLIGKTNMHELSFGVTSNNAAFGPVRNPYNTDHIAGGSSGGSAVAVAVGAAAFAMAADTGGSARIPAALCGLVGFRPTTGRWPDAGLIKVSPTRDSLGVIAMHVDDVLLVDAVITNTAESPVALDFPDLHFALLTEPYMRDVDPEVASLVDDMVRRLKSAGADVREHADSRVHDLEAECGFTIALSEARLEMEKLARRVGMTMEAFIDRVASPDVTGILSSLSQQANDEAYQRAMQTTRPALQNAYNDLFDGGAHAVLMPTTPLAAARIGEDDEVVLNGKKVPTFPTFARNTSPASVAGIPSITIPIGCTSMGLPVGLLIETRAGHDRELLAIAARIEAIADPKSDPGRA